MLDRAIILSELYDELLGVWSRYIGHVVTNVGGVNEQRLKPEQKGYIYTPVPVATQKASLDWLLKNAFTYSDTPVEPPALVDEVMMGEIFQQATVKV